MTPEFRNIENEPLQVSAKLDILNEKSLDLENIASQIILRTSHPGNIGSPAILTTPDLGSVG